MKPDGLSDEARAELEALDDQALWRVARSQMADGDVRRRDELLATNAAGTITAAERDELTALRRRADTLMLRKAYANVLLKRRGYDLDALTSPGGGTESD